MDFIYDMGKWTWEFCGTSSVNRFWFSMQTATIIPLLIFLFLSVVCEDSRLIKKVALGILVYCGYIFIGNVIAEQYRLAMTIAYILGVDVLYIWCVIFYEGGEMFNKKLKEIIKKLESDQKQMAEEFISINSRNQDRIEELESEIFSIKHPDGMVWVKPYSYNTEFRTIEPSNVMELFYYPTKSKEFLLDEDILNTPTHFIKSGQTLLIKFDDNEIRRFEIDINRDICIEIKNYSEVMIKTFEFKEV